MYLNYKNSLPLILKNLCSSNLSQDPAPWWRGLWVEVTDWEAKKSDIILSCLVK
jgi:hypothetical protein